MTAGREGQVAVTMPQLGETVAEGTVLRWLKQVGDLVADQEALLEIATDKVDAEVPSPAGGVLVEIVVGEDQTVDVGTVLAHVVPGPAAAGQRAAPADAPSSVAVAEERSSPPPTGERSSPPASTERPAGPRHQHSPRVRRLAHDGGVDLSSVSGTGPGGRVTPADVARAVGSEATHSEVVGTAVVQPQADDRPLRQSMVEVTSAGAFRAVVVEVDRPSTAALGDAVLVTAVAGALRDHRALLAEQPRHGGVDLAVSWANDGTSGSCLLPHADDLNVGGVAQRMAAGTTTAVDPAEAGFVVTFDQDEDVLFAVDGPPTGHVAHLGVGAPTARVVVVDADGSPAVGIRMRSYLVVSYDPTAVAGPTAKSFVRDVVRRATHLA